MKTRVFRTISYVFSSNIAQSSDAYILLLDLLHGRLSVERVDDDLVLTGKYMSVKCSRPSRDTVLTYSRRTG